MLTTEYCDLMSRYNQWMNTRLYQLCDTIPDAQRKRNMGAFFGSIHRTLNHLLYGDLAFLSRFTGYPEEMPDFGIDRHSDFTELWQERILVDRRLIAWSTALSPDWLEALITYTSKVDGQTRTVPNWTIVTHMFNHQTHHRGQITTLLSQLNLDLGPTDIPFMPGVAL
ncbi:damage-inducible protein DinB [filamentous cyanobacterium LEGE 11480]|uniref:Damage-inducible protein DinB n=1 Tax=Romeriopsis navalis LEGE 11480 TaxID=2777977 RepID=A0A928Z2W8_9CYAN|nr:DinB family protein [Romeriopsis navalis]MBE9030004.1 damage-inducible protein DinB [Romeriopsis navalis LEGE 11480]